MTFYATLDSDGGYIREDAFIGCFETYSDAVEYLKHGYDPRYWDHSSIEVGEGRYGDCWLKTLQEPREDMFEPFGSDGVYVSGPGGHPGFGYWTTPRHSVLVIKKIMEL